MKRVQLYSLELFGAHDTVEFSVCGCYKVGREYQSCTLLQHGRTKHTNISLTSRQRLLVFIHTLKHRVMGFLIFYHDISMVQVGGIITVYSWSRGHITLLPLNSSTNTLLPLFCDTCKTGRSQRTWNRNRINMTLSPRIDYLVELWHS